MSTISLPAQATSSTTTPLSIAIYLADQNPHRDRSQGITSMTETLMQQFAVRDDLQMAQVISPSSYRFADSSIHDHRIPFRTDRTLGRLVADAMHPWMARPDVDLWYYPKGYVARWCQPATPSVGTMHDTIVQHYADHYPETRSRRAFGYWIELTKRSLVNLTCVLTISQHAANQLRTFCDRHGLAQPNIEVTYEGSSWESIRDLRFSKGDSVIHLASAAPHKGTNRLLRHWQVLQLRGRILPQLDLVGHLDAEGERLCETLLHVTRSGPQPTSVLQESVGRARALLLPSEIEGFGLPALEAYYMGTPTCYVRGTSVAEVVQDRGRAGEFDLADVDDFQRALDWSLNVSTTTIQEIGDAMHQQFANDRIVQRIVDAFRRTAAANGAVT